MPPEQPSTRPVRRDVADLHVCPTCEQDFVEPDAVLSMGPESVTVALYCGNCPWEVVEVVGIAAFEALCEHLEQAGSAIVEDIAALQRAIREDEVARFAQVLALDLIVPEDF